MIPTDLILDYLSNERYALRDHCAISKSWVPQVRRNLFAHVKFDVFGPTIESWIKAFPDPSDSPAHLSHTLLIRSSPVLATASLDTHAWIRIFENIAGQKDTGPLGPSAEPQAITCHSLTHASSLAPSRNYLVTPEPICKGGGSIL